MRLLHPKIEEALNASGFPWTLTQGSNHRKIVLAGRLVGILPYSGKHNSAPGKAVQSTISQIRRAARDLQMAA